MLAPLANVRRRMERRFVLLLAFACVVLAAFPTAYAMLATPTALRYTGFQTNADDHMVYAAWTWQAAHGALTFDDRFAVDPQPGLTFHLYFLLLGELARFVGVVAAMTIGRLFFTGLFVVLLGAFVRRLRPTLFGTKLALVSGIVAGGLGFLPGFWHRYGNTWPVDVWQPEGFVVPSMLTNGLFMVSLCLILTVLLSILALRCEGWRPVAVGALAMAALMNVHSYDALMVGLVLLGFLAASLVSKTMTLGWAARATVVMLGALPPALWFVHVLHEDPVFAARAATETYSADFRLVVLGYLPAMLLAFAGLYGRGAALSIEGTGGGAKARRLVGLALAVAMLLVLLRVTPAPAHAYLLTPVEWGLAFLAAVTASALLAERSPARNLLVSWALVGTVAIYFPGLFQRKLLMGLSIPWGLLAALALEGFLKSRERSARNLVTALALIVLGGSAVQWTFRELYYIGNNVASTARHPVFLSPDVRKIVDYLAAQPGRNVVVALVPKPQAALDASGHEVPDTFVVPAFFDVAPFLSGLAGAYTVAGHWSETPDYNRRAGESGRFLLGPGGPIPPMTDDERRAFVRGYGVNYAVVPLLAGFVRPEDLGEIVVSGSQFDLVRLRI